MQNQDILNCLATLIKNADNQNNLSMDTAFKVFIEYSKVRCRPDTILFYSKVFATLKKGLDQLNIESTKQITKANYARLINVFSYMGYSNATINKLTDLLKRIMKVCCDLEYISSNPIAGIKKLKETVPQIKTIEIDTIKKIENYIFNLPINAINLRNIVLILLLNDTGARINEIRHIKIKNVLLESNCIFLDFTKTNKPRYVYFRDITKHYLKQYLFFLRENTEYLFVNFQSGEIISKNPIYEFIDKMKSDLKIDYSISPHKWRHTLATNLVNENVNLNEVMEVLGHTQFSTTRRYLHQENSKIKKDVIAALENKK